MKKQQSIIYFLIFLLFLIISIFMPISGDDWANYMIGKVGIYRMIGNSIGMYFDWEGRFASRLLINFFTYYKIVFDIIISLLITSFIYVVTNMFKYKNKMFVLLLMVLSIILLNNSLFTQTFLWVAGSITYLIPTILIFIYIYIYQKYLKNNNYKKWYHIILGLFSFSIVMFVENIACAYIVLNALILLFEYLDNKKINKLILTNLIISILGFVIMFLSPGTALRNSAENIEFNKLSLIGKFIYNYPNFIKHTFIQNITLILIMMISLIMLISKSKKNIKNKTILISINIFPLTSIIAYCFDVQKLQFIIDSNNIIISILWTLWGLLNIVIIYNYLKNKDNFKTISIIFVTGLISNIVMIVSPAYSSRTSLLTVMFLSIVYIYILDDIVEKKIILNKIMSFILILLSLTIIVAYYNLYKYSRFLNSEIDKQKNNNDIIIYDSPEYLSWGLTPSGDYHLKVFKEYHNIDQNKNIVIRKSIWKNYIIFDLKNTKEANND